MQLHDMQLRDIMTHDIETIRPDASLQVAAQMMAALDVGMLPVVEGDKLLGSITDRDVTVRATARGLDPKETSVRRAMTVNLISATESQPISHALQLMMDLQIRRLPILDKDQKLVGIISLGDLAKVIDDKHMAGRALERISEPEVLRAEPEQLPEPAATR